MSLKAVVGPAVISVAAGLLGMAGCSQDSPEKLVASAKSYLASNDTRAATIQLKNALRTKPDFAEARFLLGKSLLASDDPVGAEVELRKASALDHPNDDVMPVLAKALLGQGQHKKLTDEYGLSALTRPAAIADYQTSVASAYAAQGQFEKAQSALRDALKAAPDFVPAMVVQARLLMAQRDVEAARAVLDKALAKTPDDHDALLAKGDLLLGSTQDAPGALAAYRRAAFVRSDSLAAHSAIVSLALSGNDLKLAREQLAQLRKSHPGHPQARFLEARIAFQERDFGKANELVQHLLKRAPDNPKALRLAGLIALEAGSLAQAEQFLGKALHASPGDTALRHSLVQSLLRSGQPEKALAVARPMLEGSQPSAEASSAIALSFLQSGDTDKAEEILKRALELKPGDPTSRAALAMTLLARGKDSLALDELNASAAADPGTTADLMLIAAYVQRKAFEPALKAIDRLERKRPKEPQAANLRGEVQLRRGETQAARQSFERAASLDPKFYPAIGNLVALDLRDNKSEQAAQRLDQWLKVEPNHIPALIATAQLRARAGKSSQEVLALINKAINIAPSEPMPRVALINYQLHAREFRLALASAQEAAVAIPNSPEVLQAFGRAQLASGDVNQSIKTFGALAALKPKSAQAQIELAGAYAHDKNFDAALESLKKALHIDPQHADAQRKVIGLLMFRGRTSEALATALAIQAKRPRSAVGFNHEGEIEAARGNWLAAANAYRKSMEREPHSVTAEKLHRVLTSAGRLHDADSVARGWLKEHPEDARFIFYLGVAALSEQKLTSAEARFREVIRLQPRHAAAHNNLAWILAESNNNKAALEHAQIANKLKPDEPIFIDTLAMILGNEGKIDQAVATQKKAISLKPEDPAMHLTLAKLYIKAGDKTLARQELDQLSQLGAKFSGQAQVKQLRDNL